MSAKQAGSVNQYKTLGGAKVPERQNTQASERQNTQASERQNTQASERQNVQALERQNVQALERQNTQVLERRNAQTSKRLRQTAYLDPDVDRWIRHRIADTREDISDVINDAVRLLMGE